MAIFPLIPSRERAGRPTLGGTRVALSAAVAACAYFTFRYLVTGGETPERRVGPVMDLILGYLVVFGSSLLAGLSIDWLWPKTTSRWHGALLGALCAAALAAVFLPVVPDSIDLGLVLFMITTMIVLFGLPIGAIVWRDPRKPNE